MLQAVELGFCRRDRDCLKAKFESHAEKSGALGQGKLTREALPRFLDDVGLPSTCVPEHVLKFLDAGGEGVLSFETVEKLMEWPDPVKRWAASLPLAEVLADVMAVEKRDDPYDEISQFDETRIAAICDCMQQALYRLFQEHVRLLRAGLQAQQAKAQGQGDGKGAKFQVVTMSAGSVDDFHGGLEGRIGGSI